MTDVVGKDFALGLRYDVALGYDHDVRKFQHRAELARGIDAGQVVDDANGRDAADVRRTAVAQPRAFRDQNIEAAPLSPCESLLNVADKKMIRAQLSRKAGARFNAVLCVALTIKGGETIKLHHSDLQLEMLSGLKNNRSLA